MTYLQGRVVAHGPDEAAEKIRLKLENQGYEIERLIMFACLVQPYEEKWIEWRARVSPREKQKEELI